VLDNHDRYHSYPESATLLDLFAEVSTRWAEAGMPFHVVLR